jgi:hypothetical protein
VQVEDGLARSRADVDDDLVVVEARRASGLGDEDEHSLRFFGRELADVAEGLGVALGDHEEVRLRLGIDVTQGDEPFSCVDVVSRPVELTEEAVLRQRRSPPR